MRELTALPFTVDEAASRRLLCEMRRLADGRMLGVFENGKGVLYPSYAALDSMIREGEARAKRGPVDPLKELLPPASDFIRDVAAHASRLAAALSIPDAALDGTLDSLHAVDEALKRVRSNKRKTPAMITSLVAYAGEILCRACDGHWEVETWEGSTPQPIVVGRDDRFFRPFTAVFLSFDHDHRCSLHTAIEAELRTHVRKHRGPPPDGMQYVYLVGTPKPAEP